jgi:hypothetical protein
MMKRRTIWQFAAILVVGGTALAVQAQGPKKKIKPAPKPLPKPHLEQAYYAGHLVNLHSVPGKDAKHTLVIGPWNLGEKVNPKRNDKRPNLYFVSPGTQHRVENHPEYDHNEVLSAVPDEQSYFDMYWVVVLDPSVKEEFTSEQQIILATQQTFVPSEEFTFEQIPSAGFLRRLLKISDLAGLEKYRRSDGGLPQVAIITAGFTVNGVAEEIPQPALPETQESAAPKP